MSASPRKQTRWRKLNVRFGSKADMCSALVDVRFVPIADIPRGELCVITDEKQRDRLGHKAASPSFGSEILSVRIVEVHQRINKVPSLACVADLQL